MTKRTIVKKIVSGVALLCLLMATGVMVYVQIQQEGGGNLPSFLFYYGIFGAGIVGIVVLNVFRVKKVFVVLMAPAILFSTLMGIIFGPALFVYEAGQRISAHREARATAALLAAEQTAAYQTLTEETSEPEPQFYPVDRVFTVAPPGGLHLRAQAGVHSASLGVLPRRT